MFHSMQSLHAIPATLFSMVLENHDDVSSKLAFPFHSAVAWMQPPITYVHTPSIAGGSAFHEKRTQKTKAGNKEGRDCAQRQVGVNELM